jgi:nitric oxide reductase activation protein
MLFPFILSLFHTSTLQLVNVLNKDMHRRLVSHQFLIGKFMFVDHGNQFEGVLVDHAATLNRVTATLSQAPSNFVALKCGVHFYIISLLKYSMHRLRNKRKSHP